MPSLNSVIMRHWRMGYPLAVGKIAPLKAWSSFSRNLEGVIGLKNVPTPLLLVIPLHLCPSLNLLPKTAPLILEGANRSRPWPWPGLRPLSPWLDDPR